MAKPQMISKMVITRRSASVFLGGFAESRRVDSAGGAATATRLSSSLSTSLEVCILPETRSGASDDAQLSSIGNGGKSIPTSTGRFADGAHGFHECGAMAGAYRAGGQEAAELSEAGAVRPSDQGMAHAALDGRHLVHQERWENDHIADIAMQFTVLGRERQLAALKAIGW